MNQLTFLVLFLVLCLKGDVPNGHLNALAVEASLCSWLCGTWYLLLVWCMDMKGLATARVVQFSSLSVFNLSNQI